jgi:hypothetical protein
MMKKFLKISILTCSLASFLAFNPTFSMKEEEKKVYEDTNELFENLVNLQKKFQTIQNQRNTDLSKCILDSLEKFFPEVFNTLKALSEQKVIAFKILEDNKNYFTQNGTYDTYKNQVSDSDNVEALKQIIDDLNFLIIIKDLASEKLEKFQDHLEAIGQYDRLKKEVLTKNLEDLLNFNKFLNEVIEDMKNYKEVYEELEKKVKNKNKIENLYWNHKHYMPLTIFLLKDIQQLDIAYTQYLRLDYLYYLKNLKELKFSEMHLEDLEYTLPEKVPASLTWLKFEKNWLYAIPKQVYTYKNLTTLIVVNQNELEEVSDKINDLINLRTLNLASNPKLEEIPALTLPNLKNISFYNSENKKLAESLKLNEAYFKEKGIKI